MKKTFLLYITFSLLATMLCSCGKLLSKNYVEDANCNLNMKMIYVKGGQFLMGVSSEQYGSAQNDEFPAHTVELDSYYIGECEITQSQWEKIMGTSIYQQQRFANGEFSGFSGVGDDYPMYFINWYEAQEFCCRLSQITGKRYMLPTEAQWEYAARSGKRNEETIFCGGDYLGVVGWNNELYAHPVKQKQPNKLGLYDMSGNVWEWCSDWYSASYYNVSPRRNPYGAPTGIRRMLRGGSWVSSASDCRISNRARSIPTDRDNNNGFRVVCIPY